MGRRTTHRATALLASLVLSVGFAFVAAAPAAAVDGHVYGRVYFQPDKSTTSGGSVAADLDFRSRREVWITNVVLNDICPGDGKRVYWKFGVRMMDGTSFYTDPKHWSVGDCDTANETWSKLTFTTDLYQIDNAYLQVCVDKVFANRCEKTNEKDNPYTGA